MAEYITTNFRLPRSRGRSLLESQRYDVLFVEAPLVTSALARMEQADLPPAPRSPLPS